MVGLASTYTVETTAAILRGCPLNRRASSLASMRVPQVIRGSARLGVHMSADNPLTGGFSTARAACDHLKNPEAVVRPRGQL